MPVIPEAMSKLPTKSEILEFIRENPDASTKRDITRAFGIKGAAKIDLKVMLKELAEEGHLKKRKRKYSDPDKLPPVSVLQILGPDADGDLFAIPVEYSGTGVMPKVLMAQRSSDSALGQGDKVLARLTQVSEDSHQYEGRLIRRIGHNPHRILGLYRKGAEGGRIVPIDKGSDKEWIVPAGAQNGAKDGELVEGEQTGPRGRLGLPVAKVLDVLGDPSAPKAVSLIAIHQHGIPDDFPDDVMAQADAAGPADRSGRTDLTHLPLITIDPGDARDHDDACCALPDEDPANQGGFVLWVAIADVAHYVRPGTPLDREAYRRGNSSYFPDRVVPMLPDRLSGDLCSLHEGVERPCIAVEIKIDRFGEKLSHSFHRGFMISPAALSYEEAQDAVDGNPTERAAPLVDPVLKPLFHAHDALSKARNKRQPLDLELPERKIILTDDGKVASVNYRDRFQAHKLIEEFMVLANVCAAETLISKREPLLFRVHEEPSPEKLDALRETAQAAGLVLAKGQVLQTSHLNKLLHAAAGTDEAELINMTTLRSMTQAYYSPKNFGHFGLALKNYAHFTSPIRRYADLIVHRALVSAHGWGDDGLETDIHDRLEQIGTHISETERRSMLAERDTTDRYLSAFLSERIGHEFSGRVAGIAKFGIFVKLDETGADGLVPMRELGDEYFNFDRDRGTLTGDKTGRVVRSGMPATVKLAEAAPVTGGLVFELLTLNGDAPPKKGRHSTKGRRFGAKGKKKRSVKRSRR